MIYCNCSFFCAVIIIETQSDSAPAGGDSTYQSPTALWYCRGWTYFCQCKTVSWNSQEEAVTSKDGGPEQTCQSPKGMENSQIPHWSNRNLISCLECKEIEIFFLKSARAEDFPDVEFVLCLYVDICMHYIN